MHVSQVRNICDRAPPHQVKTREALLNALAPFQDHPRIILCGDLHSYL